MTNEIDEKLVRALALALCRHPRANLQQLAREAGISKATLYRVSATREGMIDLLMERSRRHMQQSLDHALLAQPPFTEALHRLTEKVMTGREYYLFWSTALWASLSEEKNQPQGYASTFFSDALEVFFLEGQKAGVFRIDMPARWLAKSYDFLLYAAIESAELGEIATVGMAPMVNKMFINGAAVA